MATNKVKENLTDWVITGWEKNKDVGISCFDAHKSPLPSPQPNGAHATMGTCQNYKFIA